MVGSVRDVAEAAAEVRLARCVLVVRVADVITGCCFLIVAAVDDAAYSECRLVLPDLLSEPSF